VFFSFIHVKWVLCHRGMSRLQVENAEERSSGMNITCGYTAEAVTHSLRREVLQRWV